MAGPGLGRGEPKGAVWPGCHGPAPGGGGIALGVESSSVRRNSEIGCEKTSLFGEGRTAGVGGPTSSQRLRK
jgi:hypothetical protein